MRVKQRIDFPVKFDGQAIGLGCRGQDVRCQLGAKNKQGNDVEKFLKETKK